METMTTVSREAIFRAVREAYRMSLERAGGRWYYATVHPDGSTDTGIEASPRYSESEYYGRRPHSVTIWSEYGNGGLDADEIEEEMDALDWAWFDLNIGDLAEKLEPTGLTIID